MGFLWPCWPVWRGHWYFKTAALALIGDLTANSHQHSKTMNTVEGFCRGAIIGPALVAFFISAGFILEISVRHCGYCVFYFIAAGK